MGNSPSAPSPEESVLPVIDIGAFASGDANQRRVIADRLDHAFCTVGFCYVSNYEDVLPAEDLASMRAEASDFFATDAATKQKSVIDGANTGYLALGSENVAASTGKASKRADPVESLRFPAYQEDGGVWRAANAAEDCPWRAATWVPATPPGFRQAAVRYWAGATKLMLLLMEMTELALELPPAFFTANSYAQPGTLLRVASYPVEGAQADEDTLRYGAHTDYDGFTILNRNDEDIALQIQTANGSWIAVPSPPGTLTINIGDLLARWTNNRWRATVHRVANPPAGTAAAPRLSMAYFTGPHPKTLVECVPSAKCQPDNPKYAPITAIDHVMQKIQMSQKALSAA